MQFCRSRMLGMALAVCLVSTPALASTFNPLITLDENGHGSLLFPGGSPIPTIGVLASDPGPSGLLSALTYNLLGPPALVAGDLILSEDGFIISDVIRFNPAGTGNPGYPASVVFYSDVSDGVDSAADLGFPSTLYQNTVLVLEAGPEGNNGFLYTPTSTQPGFVPGFAVTYDIISDGSAVPEPATLVLVGAGVAAVWRLRKRPHGA